MDNENEIVWTDDMGFMPPVLKTEGRIICRHECQLTEYKAEIERLREEVDRLRVWNDLVENKWMWIESALQFIAMAKPLDGQTWEKHSKQIKHYAIKVLEWKEKE